MIDFNLHTLGWKAFQDLCGTVLKEVLDKSFQTFAPGPDGGRDGAFRGNWEALKKGKAHVFTAQCKFSSDASKKLSAASLKTELPKIKKLARASLCDIYVLMTNQSVSAPVEAAARKQILACGPKEALIFGRDWICQTIGEHPTLRRLVPRLYGLGDLTQIIDSRAYRQADALANWQ